jgi:DNA-binding transcriptional MerR regulator
MLSIGEFAHLGRVSPRTLRHYDDVGVLSPAHVDPVTGYRWYELRQLARLRRIAGLSRELYLHVDLDVPANRVTELQIPVERAS